MVFLDPMMRARILHAEYFQEHCGTFGSFTGVFERRLGNSVALAKLLHLSSLLLRTLVGGALQYNSL